jgi:predicted NAD-dependent protein-ADP-ribosyltransferase YbiA (DUF1768 family)
MKGVIMAKLKSYYDSDDVTPITSFKGEYDWLSNFYPCDVDINVHFDSDNSIYTAHFSNAEAAFQACKCMTFSEFQKFETLGPSEAKKLGRTVQLRPDWNEARISVMEQTLFNKFSKNIELADKLIDTYPRLLIEGILGMTHFGVFVMGREKINWEKCL